LAWTRTPRTDQSPFSSSVAVIASSRYGRSGNVRWTAHRNFYYEDTTATTLVLNVKHAARGYFYTADNVLVASQVYDDRTTAGYLAGVYEEYWYDPLGRRILVRARQDANCTLDCQSSITRTIWDGDQILWEIRTQGSDSTPRALISTAMAGRIG